MGQKVYEEVFVESVVCTTEKAALLTIDSEEHWVPFSCIEENGEEINEDFKGALFIERWLCDKNGIDY